MPKINSSTGATAEGMTGIVEHGAPLNDGRTLSELDPERNLDGTLVPGEHPDADRYLDDVEHERSGVAVTDPEPRRLESDEDRAERERREAEQGESGENGKRDEKSGVTPLDVKAAKSENGKDGEDVSAGGSSAASQPKTATSPGKK